MRVLLVTNQFPSQKYPFKGSFIYTQAFEIQKKIKHLVILAPNYGREKQHSIYRQISTYRFQPFTKKTSDPLLRNLFKGFKGLLTLILFVISQTLAIIRLVKKENIDLIHAHWILPSGFSSYLASLITKRKLVITTHGSDLTFCGTNKILKKFVCFILVRISFLICVSNKLLSIANRICFKKILSKTIFIGIPRFTRNDQKSGIIRQSPHQDNKHRIIFAGSLYPIKGIMFLLKSIKILSLKRQDFIFDIVGSGDKIKEYKSYIRKNNLEKFVKFHGFRDHNETIELIKRADIAIQASLAEGLSVFLQESVFLGKPIVATKVGGTQEIVKDDFNGFLIEPGKPQEIADKINFLISNPEKIRLFGLNSLSIAKKNLSLEDNVKKIIDIYYSILNKTN